VEEAAEGNRAEGSRSSKSPPLPKAQEYGNRKAGGERKVRNVSIEIQRGGSKNNMKRWSNLILAGALAMAFAGCGGKTSTTDETAQPSGPATTGATVDPATVGSVSGSVKLDGKPVAMKPINMSAEPYCSKEHPTPVVPQDVVEGDNGSLANVVVYIKSGLANYQFPTPKDPVTLTQKGCMYEPHVVALMQGQTLDVKNDDQTTHNIHPMPKDNREWNKSQPPGAAPIDDSFARMEVSIPVKCNVHPWMKSYIAVMNSPYYAVTGKDGSFTLKDVPPGTYTVEAWQEKYGVVDQQVTIGPKESKTVSFEFKTTGAPAD
jgi:Carboxypeptidase regulatory-like domain